MSQALRIRVSGIVQGVGYRPFVWRLARELGIRGWVRNDARGVEIAAEGTDVEGFVDRLRHEAPPLARVDVVTTVLTEPQGFADFAIAHTEGAGRAATAIGPDTAVCADCLADLFEPANRRWRYAFTNCTHCGPRYTITRHLPYDRAQTSMAAFAMCADCAAEYESPADRRFHAQPNACPACGPRLALVDAQGDPVAGDPVAGALRLLQSGSIVAIKGLGGYHLACDATAAAAVARLRERKQREEKPFAVMCANIASLAPYAEVSAGEAALLGSIERPIVLLKKKPGTDERLAGVAPGLAWLGAMLPYTPLHWLLFHEAAGRPAGTDWLGVPQRLTLVMTSANPGGEPIVRDDDEARRRLADIADAWLAHDRAIVTRCDDSVLRVTPAGPPFVRRNAVGGAPEIQFIRRDSAGGAPEIQFIRRARGYTPRAIQLAQAGSSVLATGAFLKNTICLTRGAEAFVSQHIGDLDNAPGCALLEETAERLMELLEIEPGMVAHDRHPDFHSSRYAAQFAARRGLTLLAVQHHHAHIAAVAAEHGLSGPLLGLALDGVGLGEANGGAGGIWGGELLRVDGARYERLGHLRELPLPGGDKAAREPWRMAAAALHLMGRDEDIKRYPQGGAIRMMLGAGAHCPPTSSCGRWFDAAAGLLGIKPVAAFEGQAAMLLEGLAERHGAVEPWPEGFRIEGATLDLLPLLERIAGMTDAGAAAALFHATLAEGLAQWTIRAAEAAALSRVALGGGCFLNRILSARLAARLREEGLSVFEARALPPNDGGLALGQAWVAMHTER